MSLHLVIGCMFSGKTSELISRALQARASGKRVLIVTHARDQRYGECCVATHDGASEPCLAVDALGGVRSLPEYQRAQAVFVEEAQFFADLDEFVIGAVDEDHKDVTVCGLDGDYMRRPFHTVLDLVPLVDTVSRMTRSWCADCGERAIFSRRKLASDDLLLVGGAESYAPACRRCWRPPVSERSE